MDELLAKYGLSLAAFLLSAGLIGLLIKPARRLGWVDQPSVRKRHREPTPLVGGVAMCAAFCSIALLLSEKPQGYPLLLTGMILLTLIGVYDDLRSIKPSIRFLFQGGAILLMILEGKVVLNNLGDLFGLGGIALGGWAIGFTVFSAIGVINAFNMSDGIDGLAGGLALIAVGWLVILALATPTHSDDTGFLLVLAAVIAGFLIYNLRHPWRTRAGVFMGDAGSTMLGFALSWFMVHLSQSDPAVMTPMTAVWILALPLLDAVAVMIRRIRAGRSPFTADRQHLHHLLLSYGLSDGWCTAILLVAASVSGAVGVAAYWMGVPDYVQFYLFIPVFLLYSVVTALIWKRQQTTPLAATSIGEDWRGSSAATPADSMLQPMSQQNRG